MIANDDFMHFRDKRHRSSEPSLSPPASSCADNDDDACLSAHIICCSFISCFHSSHHRVSFNPFHFISKRCQSNQQPSPIVKHTKSKRQAIYFARRIFASPSRHQPCMRFQTLCFMSHHVCISLHAPTAYFACK